MFEGHLNAVIDGNDEVADFYRQRFRDEFTVAYDAWIALDPLDNPDAPASPLAMPEYQLAADTTAAELEARAENLFAEGQQANSDSDAYTLTTLLFAAVLFFAAMSDRFRHTNARIGLLALAAAGLVAGVELALRQPITTG